MNNRVELAMHFAKLGFKIGAEIGVYKGRYSSRLHKTIPGLMLYSVDNWTDKYTSSEIAARESLSRYPGSVIIKGNSIQVASTFQNNSLDFVYIDADHTYNGVMADIIAWTPKVRKDGIVSGHDYQLPDVKMAIDDYARANNIKVIVTETNTTREHPSWFFIR